jgi:hypothetical protein
MNPSFEATCDQCGAALDTTVETIEQRESEVTRPHLQSPTAIRLIGIWAIALPNILAGIYLPFQLFKHLGGLAGFIVFWGDVGLTCLWFIIFYRVTKSYFFGERPR